MLRYCAARLADALVRPRVTSLVFERALAMHQREFLAGATHAAQVVCDAVAAASRGDDTELDALLDAELVDAGVHSAICHKIAGRRHRAGFALWQHLRTLERRRVLLGGAASLEHVRLIVGAERETAEKLTRMYRLDVGSHLVVCGTEPHGLWRVCCSTPEQLDFERGPCTVQLTVSFGGGRPPPHNPYGDPFVCYPPRPYSLEPQTFTFEAAVRAAAAEPLRFTVVDVNGMAADGESDFWSAAGAVGIV